MGCKYIQVQVSRGREETYMQTQRRACAWAAGYPGKETDCYVHEECNERGETGQNEGRCAACTRQRGAAAKTIAAGSHECSACTQRNASVSEGVCLGLQRFGGREQIVQLGSAQQAVQLERLKLRQPMRLPLDAALAKVSCARRVGGWRKHLALACMRGGGGKQPDEPQPQACCAVQQPSKPPSADGAEAPPYSATAFCARPMSFPHNDGPPPNSEERSWLLLSPPTHSWGRWRGSPYSAATGWRSRRGTGACRAGSGSAGKGAGGWVGQAGGGPREPNMAWGFMEWNRSSGGMGGSLGALPRQHGFLAARVRACPLQPSGAHLGTIGKGLQAHAAQRLILLRLAALAVRVASRRHDLLPSLAASSGGRRARSLDAAAVGRVGCCSGCSCCAGLAAGGPAGGQCRWGRAQLQLLRPMRPGRPARRLLHQHRHAGGLRCRLPARRCAAPALPTKQAPAWRAAGREASAVWLATLLGRCAVHVHRQQSKLVLRQRRGRLRLAAGACGVVGWTMD